jgi:CoA:oxalate CoA-transferase
MADSKAGSGGQGPLAGIVVLDMSQGIAGPSCGGHFAEFGAKVIKIEPPQGDWMRPLGSRIAGTSAQAILYNRGKESLALDLRTPEGRDIALKLAEGAHVAIENARPGVMERLGLGFEALKARQPDIVYVSVSGFGQRGPNRTKPLVDALAQAKSGLMSVMRSRDGAPVKMDATLIDAITGLYAFQAASMALWGKQPGSGARHVDISLIQSAAHVQAPNILEWDYVGRPPGLLNPPAGNYRTADGFITVTTVNEAQTHGIFRGIGRPDMITDPRFDKVASRKENIAALRAILDDVLPSRPTAEWVALFEKEGALSSAINTYGDWLADEHIKAVDAAPPYELRTGEKARLPHLPGQAPNTMAMPGIGEHSRDVLARLGVPEAEIDRLIATGIVKTADGG